MSDYLPVDEPMGGPGTETQPSRRYMGQFVSLHYVFKAFSRRKRIWITLAVAGLLIGVSLHQVIPSKYTAQTSLLMVHNPNDDPTRDMATDVALLESEAVAQKVVSELGLQTSAQKFTGEYTGVALTDQVLQITLSAPTAADAVARANALDTAFLSFRSAVLTAQNSAFAGTLNAQIKTLQGEATSIQNQMNSLPTSSPGTPGAAELASLQTQRQALIGQINTLNQQIQSDDLITTTIVGGSKTVSGATAIVHSKLKVFLADGASGLVAGLALGLGIIAVGAIVSDRIRQRDEVASALGAPVELSVGRFRRIKMMRKRRLRRRLSRPGRPVELMSRQLRSVVQAGPSPKRLAVVSLDSLEASALSLAILAGRLAVFEGSRVMVVDLSPGRILGELLGVTKPETRHRVRKRRVGAGPRLGATRGRSDSRHARTRHRHRRAPRSVLDHPSGRPRACHARSRRGSRESEQRRRRSCRGRDGRAFERAASAGVCRDAPGRRIVRSRRHPRRRGPQRRQPGIHRRPSAIS